MEPPALPLPFMDVWTTFFLLAAGQGIFLSALLIFSRKPGKLSKLLLGAFILFFSITLFEYVLHWSNYMLYLPHMLAIYKPIAFLFGPLLFLYFKSIEMPSGLSGKSWLHFLPFILYTLNQAPFYFMSASDKILIFSGQYDLIEHFQAPFIPSYWLYPWIISIHLSIYVLLIFRFLKDRNYLSILGKELTNVEVVRTIWYRSLAILFALFVFANVSYYILVRTSFFNLGWDYGISLAMTIFIYTVGYLGFRQSAIFSGKLHEGVFLTSKYKHSSLTDTAIASLHHRLISYMETQQPYLNNELRLEDLAEALGTTRHHLSQLINAQTGTSFSNFINGYRVKAAAQLLADKNKQNEYIINIAYAAGFNNKTSFYSAFKQQFGMSPKAYRKMQHSKQKLPT